MKLINIGFGNMVSAGRVVAVVSPDSAPVKRLVKEARERGMLIDASFGRKTKSVLLMDTDHVILSSVLPQTLAGRIDPGFSADDETQSHFYPFFLIRFFLYDTKGTAFFQGMTA